MTSIIFTPATRPSSKTAPTPSSARSDEIPYKIISNREEAIRHAINEAQSGDLVLIAGKGHERYQLIDGKKIQFDERDIIKETIKNKIKT